MRGKTPDQPASVERARERALRLLAIRPRGRRELEHALTARGFQIEAAHAAVVRLEREGWFDDFAAARSLVRVKGARYGRARIEQELSRRGFSRETAAAAIASELPEQEEMALSRAFARLWRSHAGLSPADRRKKVRAALIRRGFAGAGISAMMKNADEDD